MELKFKKSLFGRWYIDLPEYIRQGGKKADLEMVAGADTMLDKLANGKRKIRLRVSEAPDFPYYVHLHKVHEDDMGSTYNSMEDDSDAWLCNVTKYVFGGYFPSDIYINEYR